MKTLGLVCLLFIIKLQLIDCKQIQEEDGVLILTDQNFDKALQEYQPLVVLFYAPWCHDSRDLNIRFSNVASGLKESNVTSARKVKVAAIESKVGRESARKYDVLKFPSIKMFKDGLLIPDNIGLQSSKFIIEWVEKKMDSPFTHIDSIEEFQTFTQDRNVVVGTFYQENSERYRVFEATAHTYSIDLNLKFGLITRPEVAQEKEIDMKDSTIRVYRKYDEVDYNGVPVMEELAVFIMKNWVPAVFEYTDPKQAEKIGKLQERGVYENMILLFIDKNAPYFEEKMNTFKQVREEYRDAKTIFTYEHCEKYGRRTFLQRHTGVVQTDCPALRGVNLAKVAFPKVKPDPITAANMRNLVNGLEKKTLKPYWRSPNIPEKKDENDTGVRVLVGHNFNDVVSDKTKHVFVQFYTPWCAQCIKLKPVYEELAETYKDRDDVIIAKIDMIENEVDELLSLYSWPVYKLWPKYSDTFVNFKENKTYDEFKKFLDIHVNTEDMSAMLEEGLASMDEEEREKLEKILDGRKVEWTQEELDRFPPIEKPEDRWKNSRVLTKEEIEEFDAEFDAPHSHDDDDHDHSHSHGDDSEEDKHEH